MQTLPVEPAADAIPATPPPHPSRPFRTFFRYTRKFLKRAVPLSLLAYLVPGVLLAYLVLGLWDVARNRPWRRRTFQRYFFGNGILTWFLSPFNLLMDLCCFPYWNRGIYQLNDLPAGHQSEIKTLIEAAHRRDIIGLLETMMGDKKRGMLFFKWYGKNIPATVDIPEYHHDYKYIRTIGISIFNKRQSTGEHYGPLRVTLRVLYNVNDTLSRDVYIRVGENSHFWQDEKLFIFDDTMQHKSVNESDAMRYCLFVDILRPSPWPWLMSGILASIRLLMAPVRAIFYKHWTFLK